MDIKNLITMANQIGSFFESMADQSKAKAGVYKHLKLYWAPKMRIELLEAYQQGHATGLSALLTQTLQEHYADLMPQLRSK